MEVLPLRDHRCPALCQIMLITICQIILKVAPRDSLFRNCPYASIAALGSAWIEPAELNFAGGNGDGIVDERGSRAHGNDERMKLDNLTRGTGLLLRIVEEVAFGR